MSVENKDTCAREQRGNDFEARILRRRSDEREVTALDEWQQEILLRLIEPVNFVDEEYDGFRKCERAAFRYHFLDVIFARFDSGEFVEFGIKRIRINACESRLAASRRSPQNKREEFFLVDGDPQGLSL